MSNEALQRGAAIYWNRAGKTPPPPHEPLPTPDNETVDEQRSREIENGRRRYETWRDRRPTAIRPDGDAA